VPNDNDSSYSSGQGHGLRQVSPAIIIYPSLLTPEILVKGDFIQILMFHKDSPAPLTEENVNWQLKIEEGLDPRKPTTAGPLFKKNVTGYIKMKSYDLDDLLLKTATQFRGLLDKRVIKYYKDRGFDKIYNINIGRTRMSTSGLYNLSWSTIKDQGTPGSKMNLNTVEATGKINPTGWEHQDAYVKQLMEKLNGPKIYGKGLYGFKVERTDRDVRIAEVDFTNPVQSYHPVFYYEKLGQIGVGHLADIHISSRQSILTKSKARVIEYEKKDSSGNKVEADFSKSPPIGPYVSISSLNMKALLDKYGGYAAVDVVIIPGDLIDYIRGVYLGDINDPNNQELGHLSSFDDYKPSIKKIWKTVEINDSVKSRYHRHVDYLTFYSLVIYFYKNWKKPIFVVSGNHDCYQEPYAISPRVLKIVRANEGIPADHNLTIYEAILIFGNTYHRVGQKEFGETFDKDEFLWFYGVLTPFSDFVINFPKQVLVGLAWGDEEDVLGLHPWDWGQGFAGHLPRSDQAISTRQHQILKKAFKYKKRLLLMTHFTFVSYREDVDFSNRKKGDVEFDSSWDAGVHDWGTFETNRKTLYEKYLVDQRTKKGMIHVIFSGHSHRRAVYSILEADYWGDNSVVTTVADYWQFDPAKKAAFPAIIVCDSAGPLPRINRSGEFGGWGSDVPSGCVATFDTTGTLKKLFKIRAMPSTAKDSEVEVNLPNTPKPRFVVALDYMDIIAEKNVVRKFECDYFKKKDEQRGRVRYAFEFWLPGSVVKLIWVKRIIIYAKPPGAGWRKVELSYDRSIKRWVIPSGAPTETFFNDIATIGGRSIFASIKFEGRDWKVRHYDFNSWWNFEIQVEPRNWSGSVPIFSALFGSDDKKYYLRRNKDRAEKPHFGWRKKLGKYK